MRTIIAPLHPEVEAELRALDRKRADIARRYIRRLRLEPDLGVPVDRGLLAEHGCRRIYFDHDDEPDDLFGARRPPARHGNQDLGEGPKWRIVYWTWPALRSGVRLVVVLAVGRGHARPPVESAYETSRRRLEPLVKPSPRERRTK